MKTNEKAILTSQARRGFTLLEMVIVMGIIALILGGAIGLMGGIDKGGELQRAKTDITSIISAVRTYKMNAGQNPTTGQGLAALVDRPSSGPQPQDWVQILDEIPKDPWGQEYKYLASGRKDSSTYEIYSTGPDKLDNTDDDVSNQK